MKTLKELIIKYNQSNLAKKAGLKQPNISEALSSGRVIYGQEVGDSLALFEVRRIDKTGADVDSPRLVMPKRAKP